MNHIYHIIFVLLELLEFDHRRTRSAENTHLEETAISVSLRDLRQWGRKAKVTQTIGPSFLNCNTRSRKTHNDLRTNTQVIVQYHYRIHLQQENNRYSICTKQISKAVQFIRANYWYKVLEVIFSRHILHSFRRRPSALLWIKVLPVWLHNGLFGAGSWVVRLFYTAQRSRTVIPRDVSQGRRFQISLP